MDGSITSLGWLFYEKHCELRRVTRGYRQLACALAQRLHSCVLLVKAWQVTKQPSSSHRHSEKNKAPVGDSGSFLLYKVGAYEESIDFIG